MLPAPENSKHDLIKTEIVLACNDLGFLATQEYKGKGWRADVYVTEGSKQVAFEIQISPQTLKKTLARQNKYSSDGIIGCWLFEKPVSKLSNERPDLPLFYVKEHADNSFFVSLSGRKELPLHGFLEQFLRGNIKFCKSARTQQTQRIKLVFFEMECWKCEAMNHIYYVDSVFQSACHAEISPDETIWGSNSIEYRPEIIELAHKFTQTEQGNHLKLGAIKRRFSRTVEHSYVSFGCYRCDSLFGDWYVRSAKMEAAYGYGQVGTVEKDIELANLVKLPIRHWCYPGTHPFCDDSV